MSENETIADICAEMRGHGRDGEFVSGYEVARLADRIEAAYNRLAIPTPEQWTEFARQGSELERLNGLYQDATNDNEQMRLCVSKIESDFDAMMTDRNALAEKNRLCCDENERLREALRNLIAVAKSRLPSRPTVMECEIVAEAMAALAAAGGESEEGETK